MDHIKEIKEIVAEQAYEQLKHNLDHVNTHELGEVVDMIKDMAEAEYYCSVVEAMEEAEREERNGNGNGEVMYLPRRRYNYDYDRDLVNRMIDRKYNRYKDYPYYDYNEPVARDIREGRSPLTRRMYMESKEHHESHDVQLQELEKYMGELSQDVTEMIADATPEEKALLHKKLSALTNKIELLNKSSGAV